MPFVPHYPELIEPIHVPLISMELQEAFNPSFWSPPRLHWRLNDATMLQKK